MIEVKDFLAEMLVFHKSGATLAGFQRILIVCDWSALLCGQRRNVTACCLVCLSTGATQNCLIPKDTGLQWITLSLRHVVLQFLLRFGSGLRTGQHVHAKHPARKTLEWAVGSEGLGENALAERKTDGPANPSVSIETIVSFS
tara:strand:+ start:2212 stop:2640 length:429 start_codon:yes stop_codon:yes gene_type:complete